MKKKDKPSYGKHRVCHTCGATESETLQIIDIVLPPTIRKRQSTCRSCLSIIIDNDINKNKEKAERTTE